MGLVTPSVKCFVAGSIILAARGLSDLHVGDSRRAQLCLDMCVDRGASMKQEEMARRAALK
jgi:hypothetical protein